MPNSYWIYWFIAGVFWGITGAFLGSIMFGYHATIAGISSIVVSLLFAKYYANQFTPGCLKAIVLGVLYYYIGIIAFTLTGVGILFLFPSSHSALGIFPHGSIHGLRQAWEIMYLSLYGATFLGVVLIPIAIFTVRFSERFKY